MLNPSQSDRAPFKVLVVGGSYAGLAATLNLFDLCQGRRCRFSLDPADEGPPRKVPVQITVVDERDGYYHLIGVPLAIASQDYAHAIWQTFDDIPALQAPEIKRIQGRVVHVDCQAKSARIEGIAKGRPVTEERYDYLIACSGLRRDWPSAPKSLTRQDYLAEASRWVEDVKKASQGVVVIGGGAVGVEIAAEIKMMQPQVKVTLIHSRAQLLSSESLPDEFSTKTLKLLRSDVDVILGVRVQATTANEGDSSGYTLTLSDGRQLQASHVINAVSRFSPTTSYLPDAACDEEGYVHITPQLNLSGDVPNAGDHYAAGDLVRWSGIKRGGAAMHQGHYAAVNIHQKMYAQLYGSETDPLQLAEVPPMMALALGKQAVGYFPTTGLSEGPEVLKTFFGDDLGYMICWNWMRLGEAPPAEVRIESKTGAA
ncbi:FAD/NAD(P)-binding domain-containing protein [Aspergillus steynii IBT 23096]|uniref:FAD/NAD(P)-binding domain-containing protein n=1 Tax=Aspergillus steynii IBT 23096 TaxID=1392250 RepID=A0A2I2FS79_9EURO|nr:FAD/NAD(P)-binding domain-containing protein [Aspergillus steynii IBT 23096]PLB43469.1 FAD/NAD(P)-binding domain-containing protein [Aspergillus steynii IBT 23096]